MNAELFEKADAKNLELISVAMFANECAVTSAREQSAGSTMGMTSHAQARQQAYLSNIRTRIRNLTEQPIPDLPASHPKLYACDFKMPDEVKDTEGKVLNTDASVVAEMWQIIAYELVKSNSAGLGGGLTTFDAARATANVTALEQFLIGVSEAAEVDFPETAEPTATTSSARAKR